MNQKGMNKDEKLLQHKLTARFHKALTQFSMISDGDRILVGLSGGKDSLCLLELLARRMRIIRPKFSVEALHIRMENIKYESDATYLDTFCRRLGVPLHIITTGFEQRSDSKKPACFLCSWHRRKTMFRFAQDEGFNKIALGHHMDDIIHTALLNQFYQGSFSTMPAVMRMQKMPVTIIRPLCLELESDIMQYARLRQYAKQIKTCPYEHASNRTSMRHIFELIEKENPEARYSIWHALEKEGKLVQTSMQLPREG